MENKKILNLTLITLAMIVIVLLGSFAYYLIATRGDHENLTVEAGNIELIFEDGTDTFQGALEFGHSAEKTFTIKNNGSIDAIVKINWENLVNTYLEGSLTYTLSYKENEDESYKNILTDEQVPRSETASTIELVNGLSIPSGKTYFYKLTITLNDLESTDQTSDLNAMLSTNFSVEQGVVKGLIPNMVKSLVNNEPLLESEIIHLKETPTFSTVATTDEGIFTAKDDTGTSYYFRGAAENNYVKFGKWSTDTPDIYVGYNSETNSSYKVYSTLEECQNATSYNYNCTILSRAGKDMYWRIIRINGDNSLRIIYDGTDAYPNGYETADRSIMKGKWVNTSSAASNSSDVKHLGYMFGGAVNVASTSKQQAQTNETNSNAKTLLETWFEEQFSNSNLISKIGDSIFCNDRSISSGQGYGSGRYQEAGNTYYNTTARINNTSPAPILTCAQKNDRFTKNNVKGNQKLSQPIGLLTTDEVVMAGGKADIVSSAVNKNFYLYAGHGYLLMSPSSMSTSNGVSFYNSYISSNPVYGELALKPVINLTPEFVMTMVGDGSIDSPYQMSF